MNLKCFWPEVRVTNGQLSWKDAEGSSHCLEPFRYCLETIRKTARVLFDIDCESIFETGTFRIQSKNIHYAIQIGY